MPNFENIVIFSDLDGTFLNDQHRAPEVNLRAVEMFTANGGRFAFASGRTIQALDTLVPVSLVNIPCILCNGSYIYDFCSEQMLRELFLEPEVSKALLQKIDSEFPEIGYRIAVREGFLIPKMTESLRQGLYLFQEQAIPVALSETLDASQWYKIVFHGRAEEMDLLKRCICEFSGENAFALSQSTDFLLEATSIDATKGTQLQWMKRWLESQHGSPVTVYAIGDYDNDLDMLSKADVSACPQNASAEIHKLAKLHTVSNNEGAIADLIRQIAEQRD